MIIRDPPNFGELRSLLASAPNAARWGEVCDLVSRWDRDELEHGILSYIVSHLDRWPDHTRLAPRSWVEDKLEGRTVLTWAMARGLDCRGMVLGASLCQRIPEELLGPKCRVLSAHNAHIGYQEMAILLSSEPIHHLTGLDLSRTPLKNDVVLSICSSELLFNLEQLSLAGCRIGNDGLGILVQADNLPNLRELDLRDSRIGLLALELLGSAPFAPQLRTLDLSDNHLGRHGAQVLTSIPALRELDTLRLRHCGLGPDGISALCDNHRFEHLTTLVLERNDVKSRGLVALSRSDILENVTHLDLGTNKIGDDGIEALVASPHIDALERVVLQWNPLTARSKELLDAAGIKHDLTEADWENKWMRH